MPLPPPGRRQQSQLWQAFLVAALLAMAAPAAATAEPIDERATELLAWVAKHTGYKADGVKVTLLQVEDGTIQRIAFRVDSHDNPQPEAVTVGETIFLPTWFQLGTNDDILVHELTHVLQFENDAHFPCRAARERQAYQVQSDFVDETKIGKKPDAFAIFLLQCMSYPVHYQTPPSD